MATQRPRISGNRWLAALWRIFRLRARAARRVGWGAQVVVLLFVFLFVVQGSLAPSTHAAPAQPTSCPNSPSPGVGQCTTQVTQVSPPRLNPPNGPIAWSIQTWDVCMNIPAATQFAFNIGQSLRLAQIMDATTRGHGLPVWQGNWILTLRGMASDLPLIIGGIPNAPSSVWTQPHPTDPAVLESLYPCPPPTPPCVTCLPQLGSLFNINFFAFAPVADIAGAARCPAGSPANAWCPPSVGSPVTLWVTGFHSARGPTSASQCYGPIDGFKQVCLSLQWNPAQVLGQLTWDFDDVQVDPTTGQASRSPTQKSGVNQRVTHTFAYSSAFDPIRQCVRTCQGDLKGPPIPSYPNGTPAFQITVTSHWNLFYTVSVTDFSNQTESNKSQVDLTQFGSPTPFFTSVTTLPLFVVSYGSVTP